jgi:L-ascorbate metabolism protein UlaG (beta-lactamase superfamily)
MNTLRCLSFVLLGALSVNTLADEHKLRAHYLANSGVMVAQGSTKVLFDPFFRNDYGVYDLVPADLEEAIFMGATPWNGVDAIFISHQHDDHFDPALVVAYLEKWSDVELYAPQQAIDRLLATLPDVSDSVLNRINGIELDRGGKRFEVTANGIKIEAVHVAHAGWPGRHTDVDNIAFRVTLGPDGTVVHLGDADKGREHYEAHREYWEAGNTRLAFAPVWLLLTDPGRYVLDEFVNAKFTIGVHVDERVPDDPADQPPPFDRLDLFTRPGEMREYQWSQ